MTEPRPVRYSGGPWHGQTAAPPPDGWWPTRQEVPATGEYRSGLYFLTTLDDFEEPLTFYSWTEQQ